MKNMKVNMPFLLIILTINMLLLIPRVSESDNVLGISISVTSKVIRVLGKTEGSLPKSQIDELAAIALNSKGSREVGQILGKMKLSEAVREDTYLRILVAQKKIDALEADELLVNLRGTPGFVSIMKGSLSSELNSSLGHIHELRLAAAAKKSGCHVISLSETVTDEARRGGWSEIDIVLSYKNKLVAIESKGEFVNLDQFRPQLEAIKHYTDAQGNKAIPFVAFRSIPANNVLKEIERSGVYMITGDAESQAALMKIFLDAIN